jgi:hypothetical protein
MTQHAIVPPKPTEVRVFRRAKMWLCGAISFSLGVLTVGVLIWHMTDDTSMPLWVVVAAAVMSTLAGIATLVLRFTEQPREVTLRRMPPYGPVIHFDDDHAA